MQYFLCVIFSCTLRHSSLIFILCLCNHFMPLFLSLRNRFMTRYNMPPWSLCLCNHSYFKSIFFTYFSLCNLFMTFIHASLFMLLTYIFNFYPTTVLDLFTTCRHLLHESLPFMPPCDCQVIVHAIKGVKQASSVFSRLCSHSIMAASYYRRGNNVNSVCTIFCEFNPLLTRPTLVDALYLESLALALCTSSSHEDVSWIRRPPHARINRVHAVYSRS